jgi:type I protein arginine methyltransferase
VPHIQEVPTGHGTVQVLVDPAGDRDGRPALWPSIGEYPCYDAVLYRTMSADDERNQRFRAALRALASGRRVLDIGTGQDLNWAVESVASGAKHVVAMEAMEESFHRAKERLASLGLGDAVTLRHGTSTELTIEPRADVCVAEIIGSLAGAEGAAAVFTDARRRHLTPEGVIVPHRCASRAAAVRLEALFDGDPVAFSADSVGYLEQIFAFNGGPFDVRLRVKHPAPGALASTSERVEILDFNGELRTDQERTVRLEITRPDRVDGVLTWLELWCLPGDQPLDALRTRTSWASIYFPLFDAPVEVRPGDVLELTFRVSLSDDGVHPDYDLTAALHTAAGVVPGGCRSPYRGSALRGNPVYAALFPEG